MDVLIIEDDPGVRGTFVRALGQAGFTCHEAGSVTDGLAVLQQHQAIHAIVCDFALPGADGSMLHQRLTQVAPGVAGRVVFVTGWGGDEKTRRLLDYTGRPVLTKPVELKDLVAAVQSVT